MRPSGTRAAIDPALLAGLRDRRAYPLQATNIEVVQTHISCVFLAGDAVYKVKKPVRFSFLDFSTLDRRRHFCEEEVRLNRRLAPAVYRGVVPIVQTPAGFRVGASGTPVEYAVHMDRLPPERLLRAVVERGEADDALLERIAAKIAAFHADPSTAPASTESARPEAIARTLRDTFDGLAEARKVDTEIAAGVADLRLLTGAALARVAPILRRRRDAGRVREGHGDLRADHICCTDALPIIDCVEFSAALRTCDVASEIAFLASELDFLDASALADTLVAAYVRVSGDAELPVLLPFFRAYRAAVRALVATLTAAETEVEPAQRVQQCADARRYMALATRRAWEAQGPFVVSVMGLSGSGKSRLATALAEATGSVALRSDVVRKRLAGLPLLARPTTRAALARLYSPAHSAAVYGALVADAARALAAGRSVVLDATFQRRDDRARVRALAARAEVPLFWIECGAATTTIRDRLRARAARGDDPSDATVAIADEQARRFEPLTAADEPRLIVATDRDPDPLAMARRWLIRRLAMLDGMAFAC